MAGLDELTKLAHPGSWRLFIAYDNLCDAEDAAVPRNPDDHESAERYLK